MIEILTAVIRQLIAAGHDIDAVYGERWLHGFQSDRIEKPTFFFQPQLYNLDIQQALELHTLKWYIAHTTDQADTDQRKTIESETELQTINHAFIVALRNYTDSSGVKPLTNFQQPQITAFHDFPLFNLPASGFINELRVSLILTSLC